jgi:hypothetical protein
MKNLMNIVKNSYYKIKPSKPSRGLTKYVTPKNVLKTTFTLFLAYLMSACSNTHKGVNSDGVEYSRFPKGWVPEEIVTDDTTKISYIEMPINFEHYHNSPRFTSDGDQINEGYYYVARGDNVKTDVFSDWATVTLVPDTVYVNAQLIKAEEKKEKGKFSTAQGDYTAPPFEKE